MTTYTLSGSPTNNFRVAQAADDQSGSFGLGQTDYDTGTGFWMGDHEGTPKFSIGNSAGNKLLWNGTSLSITGAITATTGTIGGFTIGATTITATNLTLDSSGQRISLGSGNDIIIADADDATYRLWAGNTAAASAPFSVSKTGALVASSATISGSITASALTITTSTVTLDVASSCTLTTNSVDGSDNKHVVLASAGTGSNTRGGFIILHGNEDLSGPGRIFLTSGNAPDAFIQLSSGGGSITVGASPVIALSGATSVDGTLTVSTSVLPDANDGATLGSGTASWSDLFLASGGVINWNNGNVTITQTGNTLAFAGGTSYTFNDRITATKASAGAQTIPLALVNSGTTTGTEVCLDMAPNAAGVGGRSAQIAAVNTDGANSTQLEFRTEEGTLPTTYLVLTQKGQLYGKALHNSSGAVTGTTNQYIASGTYTPTLTNTTNLSASTNAVCQWMRVGNVVTVSGSFAADPTAGGTCVMGMSLPIASDFSAISQLGGAGSEDAGQSRAGLRVIADTTNNRAQISWTADATPNEIFGFTFTYLIV